MAALGYPARVDLVFRGGYPPLTPDALEPDRRRLLQRLPSDYRAFLERHNGGFVTDQWCCGFETGVRQEIRGVVSVADDSVVEFFGLKAEGPAAERRPADLEEARVLHDAEEFLPSDVLAIARCVSSSLVCLSLREGDFGAVYYWDWYWRYPWKEAFFTQRIAVVRGRYSGPDAILADPAHPKFREVADALNFATLVRVADSFGHWLHRCRPAK